MKNVKYQERANTYSHPYHEFINAIINNDVKWVEEIISRGISPNIRLDNRCLLAVIYFACDVMHKRRDTNMLEVLLKNGADPNYWIKDSIGLEQKSNYPYLFTPIIRALADCDTDCLKVLMKYNVKIDANVLATCLKAKFNNRVVDQLVYSNIDLDSRLHRLDGCEGFTCLQVSLMFLDIQGMKLLIKKGSNVNERSTKDGFTALHVACKKWKLQDGIFPDAPLIDLQEHERVDAVKLLLDHGADMDLQCAKGKTVFDYAFEGEKNQFISETAKILVEYLAKIYHRKPKLKEHVENSLARHEKCTDYFLRCVLELRSIQKVEIENGIFLSDFLEKNEQIIENFVKRSDVMENVDFVRCEAKFPIYYKYILKNLSPAIYRRNLSSFAFNGLRKIVPIDWLTKDHLIAQLIFKHLSEDDMFDLKNI